MNSFDVGVAEGMEKVALYPTTVGSAWKKRLEQVNKAEKIIPGAFQSWADTAKARRYPLWSGQHQAGMKQPAYTKTKSYLGQLLRSSGHGKEEIARRIKG